MLFEFILITYFLFVLFILEFVNVSARVYVFDTDPDDVYKQFAQLRRIGGNTIKEMVKLLMNRLMNNYVMSFISLDGRSYGKLGLRESPLCQIVVGEYWTVSFLDAETIDETVNILTEHETVENKAVCD